MRSIPLLLLGAIIALLPACILDDDPDVPPPPPATAAPIGFVDLIPLLDLTHPGLAVCAGQLAAGDSLGAAQALLAHFEANPPFPAPHLEYGNPISNADQLMAGLLWLSGHPTAPLPEDPTWAEDPFGDVNWRSQYHTLRWTVPLLLAFQQTGDRRYLGRFLFLLNDYMEDNLVPVPPSDMTWYDMAASMRAEHLLFFWRELLIAGQVDVRYMARLLVWAHHHGEVLRNQITYNPNSNHGSFHNRSLIVYGLGLRELRAAAAWFATGFSRAEGQICNLFSSEGIEIEQSPQYHFMLWELILGLQEILLGQGLDFGPPVQELLAAIPDFATHIIKPDQTVPPVGDSPARFDLRSFAGLDPGLDFSISRGGSGVRPDERFLSYPVTGWVICRSGWGEQRDFVKEGHAVFDTGPLGGWHGHRDALSFTLYGEGRDLVVDSGNYTYNSDEWRRFGVSPRAHNVVVADGVPEPAYAATPRRLSWRTGADWAHQSAELTLTAGCVWTRHFIFLDPGEILLLDFLQGEAPIAPRLLLHFAPGALCTPIAPGQLRVQVSEVALDVWSLGDPPLTLTAGELDPIQGWYFARTGERTPNSVASFGGDERREFLSLLHPDPGGNPLFDFALLAAQAGECLTFRIERALSAEEVCVWTATGEVERRALR